MSVELKAVERSSRNGFRRFKKTVRLRDDGVIEIEKYFWWHSRRQNKLTGQWYVGMNPNEVRSIEELAPTHEE